MITMNRMSKQGKNQVGRRGVEEGTNRGAGDQSNGQVPDVGNGEVVVTSKRRQFSQTYKRQIVAEAEGCRHGEVGALLRREGLYSSQLASWRQEMAMGKLEGNQEKNKSLKKRLEEVEKENGRLQQELRKAEAIITAQKKLAALIDIMSESE